MVKYKCIKCGSEVVFSEHTGKCIKCDAIYENTDNIKLFNEETNYYGDLSEKEMKKLLAEMDTKSWKELVYERFGNDNPFLYYIITDNNRADWQYVVPLNKDSLVLDIGAGWGTLTMPLASRAKVVALDGTHDRLNFVKKRAFQEKQNNVIDFVNANVLKLPFQNNQFDLVVMNGVLEWVGASVNNGNPYDLQIEALKNIYSILKDDGYIYIGIENMYGLKYLVGAQDDHTLIPDICYLDRNEANKYANKVYGRDYKTYTYGKNEYEKMLKEAGFDSIKFYYTYPDYKTMNTVMDIDNKVIQYYNENIEKRLPVSDFNGRVQAIENCMARVGDIENHVPSYGIIAKKVMK